MKRRALTLCAGLLLTLMPGAAQASSGVLDQSNPSTDTNNTCWGHASGPLAQTFTAGKSGTLTEVDLWMSWDGTGGTATVTASIGNTSSGAPVDSALAHATATVISTPALVQFFPTPLVPITLGTAYAIVFPPDAHLGICNAADYSGAQAWAADPGWNYYSGAGHSFAYQTYLAGATVLPPSISAKPVSAPSMTVGQAVSINFTITNAAGNGPVTGVAFSYPLPSGLSVSNGSASACGGTLTETASSGIVLSGGSLADGASCEVSAMVTGNAAGSYTITTGNVSSTEGGQGNTATASINVDAYPTIAAAFSPNSVAVGASTQLTITITNPAGNPDTLGPIDLADTLPAGLTVASAAAVTTCGAAGSLTVTAPSTIALFAASVATGSPCVFSVPVTGAVAGSYTDTVTARLGGWDYTGNKASAALGVAAAAPTPTPTPAPTPTPTPAPTKAPTPPPTSTGVGPGSDNTGGTIWFLPFALVAAFGGLLVLVDRRRRRLI
jgi:uncharacterized repeat protein (TIGR01451 family)